jgi:hypothetical protein
MNQVQDVFYPVISSPEALFFTRGKILGPDLPAGTDGSSPQILLTVDVNGNVGTFEIDTTCTNPGNHLIFATSTGTPALILPSFTKGVIAVICDCPHQGDIAVRSAGDGVIDVLDVIEIIGIAFSGLPDIQDPQCPTTRGDVDNSGVTDVLDVIYVIDHVFRGGPPPVDPCTP